MTLRCKDTGTDCDWEGRADTEKELLEMAFHHGKEVHKIERTPEMEGAVRKMIRY
jgi:predicted small metal-binding protein